MADRSVMCVMTILAVVSPTLSLSTCFNITRGTVEAAGLSPQQAAWSL